jgi:hypothetical protein
VSELATREPPLRAVSTLTDIAWEGPQSAPYPSFHCQREIGFTAQVARRFVWGECWSSAVAYCALGKFRMPP